MCGSLKAQERLDEYSLQEEEKMRFTSLHTSKKRSGSPTGVERLIIPALDTPLLYRQRSGDDEFRNLWPRW